MGIYRSHTTAAEFSETAATNNMKLKFLDDGSVWARIHWLNVIKDATYFKDAAQVADCVAVNRFSKMGSVDSFGGSMVTLTNLAPKINGVSGFTGAYISEDTKLSEGWQKYAEKALILTGSTSTVEVYSPASQMVPLVAGHTYYVRVEIKQSTKQGSCDVFLGGNVNGGVTEYGYTVKAKTVSAASTWTIASAVHTLHSNIATGNHSIRLDYNNGNVAGNMYFDGLMVIDLTEAFGGTFIPTQAWCDANIPYFTGTTILDAVSSGFKRWEFMLTYPQLSSTLYNRWSQTGSPNESAPGGYTRITTAWPAHAGPLRKMASTSLYNCDNAGTTTWYAAIGQYSAWTSTQAIPGAEGNSQVETELWSRIDNLSPSQKAKIYKGNHIIGKHIYEF